MVYVADTRSNTIVDSISITGRPTFIAATLDGEFFVVISIGNGKTETNSINPTAATLTTIETATRKISVSYDIGGSEKTATNIYPTGLAISDKNVYISSINLSGSGNAAWRTNTRTFRSFVSMSKQPTSFIGYAPVSETAYLLEETEIPQLVLFNSNNDKIATIALPNKVRAICGR
jgi:DNA-binding beta-propeller fold protein YncE